MIKLTKELTFKLINIASKYISLFREYQNKTIDEYELIEQVESYNECIDELYLEQTNHPLGFDELHEWLLVNQRIVTSIHNLSLCYNKKYISKRNSKNREDCFKLYIKMYETDLEIFSKIEF